MIDMFWNGRERKTVLLICLIQKHMGPGFWAQKYDPPQRKQTFLQILFYKTFRLIPRVNRPLSSFYTWVRFRIRLAHFPIYKYNFILKN